METKLDALKGVYYALIRLKYMYENGDVQMPSLDDKKRLIESMHALSDCLEKLIMEEIHESNRTA